MIAPHSVLPVGGEKCTTAPGLLFWSTVFAGVVMSSGQATEQVPVPPPPPVPLTVKNSARELLSGVNRSVVALDMLTVFEIFVPTDTPVSTL